MVWITILLEIISNLPTIVKILVDIWDAIHGMPLMEHEFAGLLLKHQGISKVEPGLMGAAQSACMADFTAFHAKVCGSGASAP